MGFLKDRTCPKCGAEDALHICAHTFAVSCSECLEVIRVLTKKESARLLNSFLPWLLEREAEKLMGGGVFIEK